MGRARGGSVAIGDKDRIDMIEARDSIVSDIEESFKDVLYKLDNQKVDQVDEPDYPGRHRASVLKIHAREDAEASAHAGLDEVRLVSRVWGQKDI